VGWFAGPLSFILRIEFIMALTYLDLCNNVLRRINEVEFSSSDFDGATGLHAAVKDSVKHSIAKINSAEFEWPYNAATDTITFVAGTETYIAAPTLKTADFNSFQIQKDDTLGVNFKMLSKIELDEYYRLHKDNDDNAESSGRGVPDHVYMAHGLGSSANQDIYFGFTPTPDKTYQVKYNYYAVSSILSSATSTTRIPDQYEHVIIDGAVHFMFIFKENMDAAQLSLMNFQQGIKEMQSQLINTYERVTDRRVQFGGGKIGVQVADRV
tara:strand:- start:765 stop:1568 length:804 start_codon:yes stop_codon:yes gene_type:complete